MATKKLSMALESQNLSTILQIFHGKTENTTTSSPRMSFKQELKE